jgi:hypothetical protein
MFAASGQMIEESVPRLRDFYADADAVSGGTSPKFPGVKRGAWL